MRARAMASEIVGGDSHEVGASGPAQDAGFGVGFDEVGEQREH